MKWFAALLMIANVTVFLWASGRQGPNDEISVVSTPDVNKEGMLLLVETGKLKQIGIIENSEQSEINISAIQENLANAQNADNIVQSDLDPEADSSQTGENTEVQTITSQATDAVNSSITTSAEIDSNYGDIQVIAQSCYRVGPFKKEESWQAAIDWMTQNEFSFVHVASESRELRAVRVYLGPFASIGSTAQTVEDLKQKSLDHFVYLEESGSARISLGYFTQQELATKFLEYLESIEVEANSQPEYRKLGPFNWMEIPVGSVEESQIISHDWSEANVGLSRVNC